MRENEEVQVEVEVKVERKTTDKRHISSWHHKAIAMIHVATADAAAAAAAAAAATAFAALPQKCRENQENYSLYAAFCLRIERMNFCQAKQKKSGNKKTTEKIRENLHLHNIFLFTCVCMCVWVCFNAELGTTTTSGAAFVWQTVRFISLMQHYMLHVAHVICVHLNMHYVFESMHHIPQKGIVGMCSV